MIFSPFLFEVNVTPILRILSHDEKRDADVHLLNQGYSNL